MEIAILVIVGLVAVGLFVVFLEASQANHRAEQLILEVRVLKDITVRAENKINSMKHYASQLDNEHKKVIAVRESLTALLEEHLS